MAAKTDFGESSPATPALQRPEPLSITIAGFKIGAPGVDILFRSVVVKLEEKDVIAGCDARLYLLLQLHYPKGNVTYQSALRN